MLLKTIKEALFIIMAAALLASIVNSIRPDGRSLKLWGPGLPAPDTPSALTPAGAGGEIAVETAIKLYRQETVLIIDARTAAEFAKGHIKNALNLPEADFDEWIGTFIEDTPPETPIITYCAGGSCQLAVKLAEKLMLVGFEKVYHLVDGWGKWQAAGMPIATGPQKNAASD